MTVRIWFFKPVSDTWTYVKVYRSTSESGTYTYLAMQALTDDAEQYYDDEDGSSSYWYKVSFWDDVNESSLSDAVRGGDVAYYSTVTKVRSLSGLSSDDVTDAQITDALVWANNLIDEVTVDPRYYWEYFYDQGDNRILEMQNNSSFFSFNKVYVDGKEVFEFATCELMDNPEFDEGDFTEEDIEDWTYLTGTSYSTFEWDNSNQFKGNRCVSIAKTDNETAYWYTTDNIDVEYPTSYFFPQYKFTCYIKTSSVTAGTGNGAYLQIAWYDSSDDLISTKTGTAVTGTQAYTQSSVTGPAPYNAAYAVARCVHDGSGGTAYFDVCSFRQVNWSGDTDNDMILLSKTHPKKPIAVMYRLRNLPGIIENLCAYIAARTALVNASGGSVASFDYKLGPLNVKQTAVGKNRITLIESLTNMINEALDLLEKRGALRDEYMNDFTIDQNEEAMLI